MARERQRLYSIDPKDLLDDQVSSPCGHCGRGGWFRFLSAHWAGELWITQFDQRDQIAALYQCGGCENASLFIFQTYDVGGRRHADQTDRFPTAKAGTNDQLPVEIEQDRREAVNCYLNSQHRAAILMARSALQRAVRTLDPEFKGTLFEEIENLERHGAITAALSKAAHEVRLTGNDVAHPSEMGGCN